MSASKNVALRLALSVGLALVPLSTAAAGDPVAPSSSTAPVTPAPPVSTAPVSTAPVTTAPVTTAPVTTAAPLATSPNAEKGAANNAVQQGVLVICIGDDAAAAARSLARDLYGVPDLRPTIDDVTARVLAGETPKTDASAKLLEIVEVRKAAESSSGDAITRRLFTSLGTDLGAALVVPVTIVDGRPTARILSVGKGTFEPVALSGSIEPDAESPGTTKVVWSGVANILATLLPKPSTSRAVQPGGAANVGSGVGKNVAPSSTPSSKGPLATKTEEPARPFWSSPWTWVGIGAVAVAGVVVFAVSQTQGDAGSLRLQGRVSP